MLNGLEGRNAVVTGSTSGIGLAIAETLAQQGSNVMLNGLGDASEIEQTRQKLARSTNRKIGYSAANMREPRQVSAMIDAAREAFGSVDILINNAGIQHVAPVDEFPEDKWDAITGHQSFGGLSRCQSGPARDERERLGPHRQCRLRPRPDRLALQVGLCRRQARHRRLHQSDRAGDRRGRHHLQCHLPRLCAARRWSRSRSTTRRKPHGIPREKVIRDVLLKSQPTKRFVEASRDRRAHRLPVQRCGRVHHRHRPADRWRLDSH